MPAVLRWTALALLGIVVAAAVSVAASRLASQQIGLASEPISAGDALAPARGAQPARPAPRPRHHHHRHRRGMPQPGSAPTGPAQPAPAPEPSPTLPTEEPERSHQGGDGEHGGGADD